MMSFIQSGSETRIYRIFSGNNLDGICDGWLSQHNSLTSFDDDAEIFLLNFLMCVQIASRDICMTTQNCIQNTVSLQNGKYLLNLKQDLWEHLCSRRPLAQGHWSCKPIHWNSCTCEKTCSVVHLNNG